MNKKKKKQKTPKGQNKHHLIPKCRIRDLTKAERNCIARTLNIKIDRHTAWHQLFGVMTLDEVIGLLKRIKRAKFSGF